MYLTCAGLGRFLVEFVRVNPRIYFDQTLSNLQFAALIATLAGAVVIIIALLKRAEWIPQVPTD